MADPLAIARSALADQPAWVVGGSVRDRLLGLETFDIDIAITGDAEQAARAIGRAGRAPAFPLSDTFGAWRVIARDRSWQVDLTPLVGATIDDDLRARDFTINAMAEPLAGGEILDPTGGRADLEQRRLRMVSSAALDADPLRVLRLARQACELGFEVEPETRAAATGRASRLDTVAAERVFAELRSILRHPTAVGGIRLADDLSILDAVLPELVALKDVSQSPYHHLDVYGHTLAVLHELVELQTGDDAALGEQAETARDEMSLPFADVLTRGEALRFGALLHDVAKPPTRAETPEGRITFMGHDEQGARAAHAIIRRLRGSEALASFVAGLTRHHLRLGFLVHHAPLSRRQVFAYLETCDPVEVEVTILSVADRLATRGRKAEEAIGKHLALAGDLLGDALAWRSTGRPAPLIRGDELAAELGMPHGPELGKLMRELEIAAYAGEITTRDEAVAHARTCWAN